MKSEPQRRGLSEFLTEINKTNMTKGFFVFSEDNTTNMSQIDVVFDENK